MAQVLAQQTTPGPANDLMRLLKGESPVTPADGGAPTPPAPTVRVTLFKPPTVAGSTAHSSIMIVQKDDKAVTAFLQAQVK